MAAAAPTQVKMRVEGATQTIFEGDVTTDGHDVTTPSGGTHKCDGTNGGANPSPGPTPTAALDDGTRARRHYTWDGTWFDDFQDFLVDRVGRRVGPVGRVLGPVRELRAVAGRRLPDHRQAGDEVLWVFDPVLEAADFTPPPTLKLSGPTNATTDEVVDVTVVDGANGAPDRGRQRGQDGHRRRRACVVAFRRPASTRSRPTQAGLGPLERAQPVRGPAGGGAVHVDGPDRRRPSRSTAPDYASDARSGRFSVSWQGDDGEAGSGVATYDVEVRRVDVVGARLEARW